ncbi:MAG: hypothetical protein ACPGQS_00795 [Bradymonadia bacterium]
MQTTIISLDPEGGLFGYVSEFEKTYQAQWLYCESFEVFLNHVMNATGGLIVLPHSQLRSVESCLGTSQSAWKLLVLAQGSDAVATLAAERPEYHVAMRVDLNTQLSLVLAQLLGDEDEGSSIASAESEFDEGTLAESDLNDSEDAEIEVPIFSLEELAEFEAEMDQAFSAVGEIDPESKVDLSVFGDEWSSEDKEKPIDPAVMTMELNVSDLEDLEDISGVFDSVSDLDNEQLRERVDEEIDFGDESDERGLLVETQLVEPDMVVVEDIDGDDAPSLITSTPFDRTQVVADEMIEEVAIAATQIVEDSMIEGVTAQATQVVDEAMVEGEFIDGTQVIEENMIESELIDGTQAVDEQMIEAVASESDALSADEQAHSVVADADQEPESASLNEVVTNQTGLVDVIDFDSLLVDDKTANGADDVSEDAPQTQDDADADQELVAEVDDAQVVEVFREPTADPRDIMAVDAEMVLESIAEFSEEPAPKAPVAKPENPKEQDLVAVRKRLLELQLDLKLSREEGETLRREVDERRTSELKLKDQVRTIEVALRESETARTSMSEDLAQQSQTLQETQTEIERLNEVSRTKASELSESLNRQDMLESAREAAEYEVQTMSKRYEETKTRLEKTRDELGELEQEFKRTKKKHKIDVEKFGQEKSEFETEHRGALQKLREQVQSLEKVVSTRDAQFNALSDEHEGLQRKLESLTKEHAEELAHEKTEAQRQETELLTRLTQLEESSQKVQAELNEALAQGSKSVAEILEKHQTELAAVKEAHAAAIESLSAKHESALKSAIDGQELTVNQTKEQSKTELARFRMESDERLDTQKRDYEAKIDTLESQLLEVKHESDVKLTTTRTELLDRHKEEMERLEFEHGQALERQATTLRKEYDHSLESRLAEHGGALTELREKYQEDMTQVRESYEEKMGALTKANDSELEQVRALHAKELLDRDEESQKQISGLQTSADQRIDELRASHKEAFSQSEAQHESAIQTLRDEQNAALESLKAEYQAKLDAGTEKASVSLEALRAELEGRQIELESTLKSNAETRLQEHKDEALRQRTDFEAQIGQLQQTIEELKTEVERARLAAHERVRKEALAENAAQVSALEARIFDAEEKHQLAESNWAAKQTALEEEFRVKSSQAEDEYKRLQEEYNTSKERTAQVTEELDQVRDLLAESNVRIDGLADKLKQETNRANETVESLKQVKKALQASETRLEDTETEKANLAKEYAAKAADLESAYKIDQTLRQELETSLTDMGQSLAQRESELMEFKQNVERLNSRIVTLETENRTVVDAGARLRSRLEKLKTLLLDDDTEAQE